MKDTKDNKLERPKPIRKISNKKSVKPPKFNPMWIYGILLLAIVGFMLMLNSTGGTDISEQKFETQYLKTGDVEKIVASKNGDYVVADVYIKPDSFKVKPAYLICGKSKVRLQPLRHRNTGLQMPHWKA